MKRNDYEKPTMKVVELNHRTMLLAGSGDGDSLLDYNWNNPNEE